MDSSISNKLKSRLDSTVAQLTEMIKGDIYENIIVSTVKDWFEGNDSILTLNKQIKKNIDERWSFIEQKVKSRLLEFEEYSKSILETAIPAGKSELDVQEISNSISQSISVAIGAIGTSVIAIISGGAGTALIAGGPVGIIIGAIIGIFAFFLGKEAIEKEVSKFIIDKKIPKMIKKTAKGKVSSQLKLNESKFEQEIFGSLKKFLDPVYKVIENAQR